MQVRIEVNEGSKLAPLDVTGVTSYNYLMLIIWIAYDGGNRFKRAGEQNRMFFIMSSLAGDLTKL